MKSAAIILLLFLSVLTATLFHSYKISHEEDETDLLAKGLSGVEKIISPGTNIYFRQINCKDEIHTWARYLLTPGTASFSPKPCDTTLTIHNIHDNDSITHSITFNQRVLWQNKDNNYHYILTSSK